MRIAGGIVSIKPIGGIVSNNPNFAQQQQQQAQREATRQAQVDAIADKLAAQHQAKQAQQSAPTDQAPKWTVPFI